MHSRTKDKAGVFNLVKHTKVDGMVILAIKVLLVFLRLEHGGAISSEVNSKSPCYFGILFQYHCNSLYLQSQKQEQIRAVVVF